MTTVQQGHETGCFRETIHMRLVADIAGLEVANLAARKPKLWQLEHVFFVLIMLVRT